MQEHQGPKWAHVHTSHITTAPYYCDTFCAIRKLFESLVPNYNTKFLQITKCSNFRRDPRLTPAPLLAWRVLRAH